MSVHRMFDIVYTLLARRQVTAAELAARFEVSARTIYRDIDALSEAGVPVYATRGKGGGIFLMDGYTLPKTLVSAAEQEQILIALQALSPTARIGSDGLLKKMSALFQKPQLPWIEVDFTGWGRAEADKQAFDALRQAILDRRVVSFAYVSSYGQAGQRRVRPIRLVFKARAWYFQGYCLERQAFRIFKLVRMRDIKLLEETFEPMTPPPFELAGPAPQTTRVRLRAEPSVAFRLYDEFGDECISRDAEGYFIVQTDLATDGWLYGLLLSFGAAVEVLEPEGLRHGLAQQALKIFARHTKHDISCQQLRAMLESDLVIPMQWRYGAMEGTYCQSCGMPLPASGEENGLNADGSKNADYCKYCYEKGAFTGEMTMHEMIEVCVPYMAKDGMTEDQARQSMLGFFPSLKRWKNETPPLA